MRLEAFGYELRRPFADVLRDGIHELRFRIGTVQYRVLYSFHGQNAVVLSHGLTKESKVPDRDIDLAVGRMQLVKSNAPEHLASWSFE